MSAPTLENCLTRICMVYIDKYLAGKIDLDFFVRFRAPMEIAYELYTIMVGRKRLVPIEALTMTEKNELWGACKKYIEPMTTQERIKFCKCYWLFSYLAENHNQ